jgi:hypothetical protein
MGDDDDDDDEGWQDQEEDDMPPRRSPEISVSNFHCPAVVVPILKCLKILSESTTHKNLDLIESDGL